MVDYERLDHVPSEEDLDRIKDGLDPSDEVTDGGYSDAELLDYSIEKEKFRRNNKPSDYDTKMTGKFISTVSGVGVGIFTSVSSGLLLPGLAAGVGTAFGVEYGLQGAKYYLEKPRDEDKEEAIRDRS